MPKFVKFTGAAYETIDEEKIYRPLNTVYVNPAMVCACYEHTIMVGGNKILVMESQDEIVRKLEEAGT